MGVPTKASPPTQVQVTIVRAPWCWFVYDAHDMVIAHGVWHRGNTAEEVAMEQIARRLWAAAPDYWQIAGMVCRAWPSDRPDEWVESRAAEWLGLIGPGRNRGRRGAA